MPRDPRKHQKKLDRNKAKSKAKKRALSQKKSMGLIALLKQFASAPIRQTLVSTSIEDEGMGSVTLSRNLPDGRVAVANFLIDRYCLGVKDAFGRIVPVSEYETHFNMKKGNAIPSRVITPETARKLVEDAVVYGKSIGFSPHPDYLEARILFGNIDPSLSDEDFEFGDGGKPHFINGPNDSLERIRTVVATLTRTCGAGNFQVTILNPEELEDDLDDWNDEDQDDDEETPSRM